MRVVNRLFLCSGQVLEEPGTGRQDGGRDRWDGGPSPAPQPGMPLNPVERGAQPGRRDEAATGPSAPGGCAPGEAGGHRCRRVACGW